MDVIEYATVEPLVVVARMCAVDTILLGLVVLLMVLVVVVVLEIVVTRSVGAIHPPPLTVECIVIITAWINRELLLLALRIIRRAVRSLFKIISVVNMILRVVMWVVRIPVVIRVRPIALVVLRRVDLVFVQVVTLIVVVLVLGMWVWVVLVILVVGVWVMLVLLVGVWVAVGVCRSLWSRGVGGVRIRPAR